MRNGRSCYLLPRQVADASPPLSYPSFFLLLFPSHSARFLLGSCSVPARFLLGFCSVLTRGCTATLPRPYRYLYLNCRTFGANRMKTGRSNITNSQTQANRMPNKHAANYFRQCFLGFVRFRNPICSIHLRISEKSSIFAA